jgi:hypothetical protein
MRLSKKNLLIDDFLYREMTVATYSQESAKARESKILTVNNNVLNAYPPVVAAPVDFIIIMDSSLV